jgi:nitrite reductase/ring-hydroxylating ferredoxin subunit
MTDVLPPKAGSGARPLEQVVPEPDGQRYPFRMPFGWFQMAWSDELKPGDVLPRYYFGRHLVLWRDHDGHAHVNDAFCPHLGGHFGYGGKVVKGCQLQCPFHGWEFDAAGDNTCIPYSERTNQKAKVRSYPVRELADHIISVWYHPDDADPLYELEIPSEMTDPEFGDWSNEQFSVNAAAQELAENSVDGPHFRYVHNTEIVPEIQSYDTDGFTAHMRSVQKFPTPRGVVDGRIDVDNQGPGFGVTRFSGIVDTFLIGAAIPVDENRCEVRFSFKTRSLGDAETTSSVGRAFVKEVCKQFEEDRPIWENKAHLRRPALADTDPPFMKFRKWYSQFYAEPAGAEHDVWAPPAPEGLHEGQPVFVAQEATASRKHRSTD